MTFNEYQNAAARTINPLLTPREQEQHSLFGMSGEVGELHSIYQKGFQGHLFDVEHVKKEVGDILWMLAEYCTANSWSMDDIAQMNIDKLKRRYPIGFESERSVDRKEDDI